MYNRAWVTLISLMAYMIKSKNIKVLFDFMKRSSLMTPPSKCQTWRKYPSAVLKAQATLLLKHTLPENSLAIALNISTLLCENIIEKTEEAIEQLEQNKFIVDFQAKTKNIELAILNAISPAFEKDHYSPNCPQDEPMPTVLDYICSGQKQIEKKLMKREAACISAFNTPLRELKQKEKQSFSTKDLFFGQKRNTRNQLVPLPSPECQEDIRSTLLQTFYRDKFARQDSINQQENIPKPQKGPYFRKANPRDKEQYAFDYDGQKIPIISSNSMKSNPVKVLKTVYKVHKQRTELRGKKTHQSIRFGRFPEVPPSNRFIENGADLHELKRGIEQNVRWTGKLQSIKLITQNEEAK